jgi:hypothetical protein
MDIEELTTSQRGQLTKGPKKTARAVLEERKKNEKKKEKLKKKMEKRSCWAAGERNEEEEK